MTNCLAYVGDEHDAECSVFTSLPTACGSLFLHRTQYYAVTKRTSIVRATQMEEKVES